MTPAEHLSIDFRIGAASAALQIEGGDTDTNWHDWARTPGNILDGSTPARATDHWNRWREDNEIMGSLGMQITRIGLEWARIEPRPGEFDYEALDRYREEIEDLISRGIHPLVTLHHFTHPMWFQEMGEFTNPDSVEIFLRFARVAVTHLGDLVTDWVTINEPNVHAVQSYLFREGPPAEVSWTKLRRVLRNFAEAHCRAYLLIHEIVDDTAANPAATGRRANVTFAHHVRVFAPQNPANPIHRMFTRMNEFLFHEVIEEAMFSGKFHPILGRRPGDLPVRRYADAIGINYYSRTAVTGPSDGTFDGVPTTDMGWEIYPDGLIQAAERLHRKYPAPIWVTENGCADSGRPDLAASHPSASAHGSPADVDVDLPLEHFRTSYLLEHLSAIAASPLPFERYYHWCFLDNWEWSFGEVPRFGIVHVDYETQKRTVKPSGRMLRDIIAAGALTPEIRARYATGHTSSASPRP